MRGRRLEKGRDKDEGLVVDRGAIIIALSVLFIPYLWYKSNINDGGDLVFDFDKRA